MKRHLGISLFAAAIAAIILIAVQPAPVAKALPGYQSDCSSCHGSAGSYPNNVGAVPSASTLAPGASYNVAISMSPAINGASGTGYWIANSTAGGSVGASTFTFAGGMNQGANGIWNAQMTAPTTPGTYYYIVFGQSGPYGASGHTGYALYNITVAAAVATNTPVPPAATSTALPPTATPTATRIGVQPTATNTPLPPTATNTPPSSSPTPGKTPTAGKSATPTRRPTATRIPPRVSPTRAPTVTRTPAPGRTPPPTLGGRVLYETLCAACHTPSSPAFVGKTVCGESAGDIREAIGDVKTMQFLKGKLSDAGIRAIASYLKTLNCEGTAPERESGNTDHASTRRGFRGR